MMYSADSGVPETLQHLNNAILAGLPNDDAQKWPSRFLAAITEGSDLSRVWSHLAVWLLTDNDFGVCQYARGDSLKAVDRVVELYRREIAGESVSNEEWAAARAAAWAARAAAGAAGAAAAAAAAAGAAWAAGAAAWAARFSIHQAPL